MKKSELRKEIKTVKSLLSAEEKRHCAAVVKAEIENSREFAGAKKVLLYHSLPDELSTVEMLSQWHTEKEVFLPTVEGDELILCRYTPERMKAGAFGIMEACGESVRPDEIDLIIVPGTAFDTDRNRLGRGKGFYDRLLADTGAYKIGVAYDMQVVDAVPCEPHDIKLDRIITEKRTI